MRNGPGEIAVLAVVLSTLIFVFGPLHLVFVNSNLWWLGSGVFFGWGGLAALATTAPIALLGLARPLRPFLIATLSAGILFYFVMIVFFPHSGGLLDGRESAGEPIWTIVTVIVLLLGIVTLAVLAVRLARRLSYMLAALLVGFFVVATLMIRPQYSIAAADHLPRARSSFESIGSQGNVFVFIVDMLQGSLLERALQQDPTGAKSYDGFEFFTRALSAFPMTGFSVPNLLSGRFYNETEPTVAGVHAAALRDSFLIDARAKGFAVAAMSYEKDLPLTDRREESLTLSTYLGTDGSRRSVLLYSHMLLASLQRNTKIPLIAWERLATWLIGAVPIAELNSLRAVKLASRDALVKWTGALQVGAEPLKLIIQHHMVAHTPVLFTRTGDISQNQASTVETVSVEYLYAMDLVGRSLDRLKVMGVYDSSLIVVVGDHGHFLSAMAGNDAPDFASHEKGLVYRWAGMYNPAMLIKRPGAKGPMRFSAAPLALQDVRAIINAYLQKPGGEIKESVLDTPPDERRRNTVFTSRKNITRLYWFTDLHERLDFHGNVTALPKALLEFGREPQGQKSEPRQ